MPFEVLTLPSVPVRKYKDAFTVNYYLRKGYADLLTFDELTAFQPMLTGKAFSEFLTEPPVAYTQNATLRPDGLLVAHRLTKPSKLTGQLTRLTTDRASNPYCHSLAEGLDMVDALAGLHGGEALRLLAAAVKAIPLATSCTPRAFEELNAYIAALPA